MQGLIRVCRIICKDMENKAFIDWRYVRMKRIISMGAAFLFVLSAGMTSSAGYHAPCVSRVIQGSGLCWYGENRVGGHHLFGHEGWTDCGACGVDVGAICSGWGNCHDGYGAGTAYSGQGMDAAPESQPSVNPAAESQPAGNPAEESQPAADPAAESQPAAGNPAEAQTGNGTAAAGAGYQNYNGAGYGGGGHCYSGSYTTGHHGSGHHGRGHH